MFCSKCGNQIADNVTFCPVCGNQMNVVDPVTSVQPEYFQAVPNQQYAYAPVAEPQPPKKSGTGLKIGIVIAAIVAVVAIVFAVLLGTGTISFDKDNGEDTHVSEDKKKPVIKEPEIGTISDKPVVTADESVDKVMFRLSRFNGDTKIKWMSVDYADESNPIMYWEYWSHDGTKYLYLMTDNIIYAKTDSYMDGKTMKIEENVSTEDVFSYGGMYYGRYDEDFLNENKFKFEYLGKEETDSFGEVYVYKMMSELGDGSFIICWIDADTGYWVRWENDGQVSFEVSEIITGNDIEFPIFDLKNAVDF